MSLNDLVEVRHKRVYCLKADFDASPSLVKIHGEASKIYGTPNLEFCGKPMIGWSKGQPAMEKPKKSAST